jgi:hypothetical protein
LETLVQEKAHHFGLCKKKVLHVFDKIFQWNVSSVASETSGIVPTECDSKTFGKVTMYDLAGHEEYHAGHETLFESVSQAVVLIVVDLSKGLD